MESPYADLTRPPLSERALADALVRPETMWREVRVVGETGSSNDDVAELALAGAPEGLLLVAEYQSAGRGRLDRTWVSPQRAGISVSVLLRPTAVPMSRWAWLPLLAGCAVSGTVRELGEVPARLKWPNDVLVDGRKIAGVLVQLVGGGAVVGVGLNVSTTAAELPRDAAATPATSLVIEGAQCTDRDPLLRAFARRLADDYQRWCKAAGDPLTSGLLARYHHACDTLGRDVNVTLPGDRRLTGRAERIDDSGGLVVVDADGEHVVAAGDVLHVR